MCPLNIPDFQSESIQHGRRLGRGINELGQTISNVARESISLYHLTNIINKGNSLQEALLASNGEQMKAILQQLNAWQGEARRLSPSLTAGGRRGLESYASGFLPQFEAISQEKRTVAELSSIRYNNIGESVSSSLIGTAKDKKSAYAITKAIIKSMIKGAHDASGIKLPLNEVLEAYAFNQYARKTIEGQLTPKKKKVFEKEITKIDPLFDFKSLYERVLEYKELTSEETLRSADGSVNTLNLWPSAASQNQFSAEEIDVFANSTDFSNLLMTEQPFGAYKIRQLSDLPINDKSRAALVYKVVFGALAPSNPFNKKTDSDRDDKDLREPIQSVLRHTNKMMNYLNRIPNKLDKDMDKMFIATLFAISKVRGQNDEESYINALSTYRMLEVQGRQIGSSVDPFNKRTLTDVIRQQYNSSIYTEIKNKDGKIMSGVKTVDEGWAIRVAASIANNSPIEAQMENMSSTFRQILDAPEQSRFEIGTHIIVSPQSAFTEDDIKSAKSGKISLSNFTFTDDMLGISREDAYNLEIPSNAQQTIDLVNGEEGILLLTGYTKRIVDGDSNALVVIANGVGIDEDELDKIINSFISLNPNLTWKEVKSQLWRAGIGYFNAPNPTSVSNASVIRPHYLTRYDFSQFKKPPQKLFGLTLSLTTPKESSSSIPQPYSTP